MAQGVEHQHQAGSLYRISWANHPAGTVLLNVGPAATATEELSLDFT
jgi:hypothetical protein